MEGVLVRAASIRFFGMAQQKREFERIPVWICVCLSVMELNINSPLTIQLNQHHHRVLDQSF